MRHVTSRDGTRIAYWTSGQGPPLLLVHGAVADHTRWRPLLPFLEPYATVHVVDRRGRGASGDAPRYELAREYEDVAALVDAIARSSGSRVDVYGHSHGGLCAFGAATLTSSIHKLVLYEGWPLPDPAGLALPVELQERLDALLAKGDREAVVEAAIRYFAPVSDEDMAALRAAPSWPGRVAAAHTISRECAAAAQARLDPRVAAKVTVPVLLFIGEHSTDPAKPAVEAVVSALPDARITVLEGQEHIADAFAPELVADRLLAFLERRGDGGGREPE